MKYALLFCADEKITRVLQKYTEECEPETRAKRAVVDRFFVDEDRDVRENASTSN